MNKEKLKDYLISTEKQDIQESVIKYEDYLMASDLDHTTTIDPEDLSYRDASSEITDNLDQRIHEHKQDMASIEEIDFSETSQIKPGAVAQVNQNFIVVGVATTPFKMDGDSFIGISVHSPLYPAIADKKAGDHFEFKGQNYTIEKVW